MTSFSSSDKPAQEDRQQATNEEEEDQPRDDEGLLLNYDVILCGTGLVQSIVASALARAGKSVLHVDGAEQYGELDAVWSLDYIQEELKGLKINEEKANEIEASSSSKDDSLGNLLDLSPFGAQQSLRIHSCEETTTTSSSSDISVGTAVQTPYGRGTIQEISATKHVSISLTDWKLADGSHPTAYFGLNLDDSSSSSSSSLSLRDYSIHHHKIQSLEQLEAQAILQQSRYLALDATPQFILATGRAVQGMLASGVAEYLEFKTLEGLYYFDENDSSVSRVPCSKGDVFSTKLLAPMDKRRLMKFLQLSLDYATSVSVQEEVSRGATSESTNSTVDTPEEVQSLNERHLNQGRSLARPQNKAVSTKELEELEKYMDEDSMTFELYLKKVHKLSDKLVSIVRYALAMDIQKESTSIRAGMNSLRQHLQALGRYGNTPFLIPMYGSGELSQAFCRSAAVYGATYLLRRAPKQVLLVDSGGADDNDSKVKGIILAGLPPSSSGYGPSGSEADKEIQCSHVVVSAEAMAQIPDQKQQSFLTRKRILRRICVLRGKLMQSSNNDEQRHVIVFPPNCIGNSHVIHGVALDDSVQVAPRGCTVLHLTTTVDVVEASSQKTITDNNTEHKILAKACDALLDSSSASEIYHLSFSHEVVDHVKQQAEIDGLHVCHHTGQALAADAAFEQAEKIFSKICPGMDFLGLSTELETLIKERTGDRGEDDDERYMLDSAVGMIGTKE